MLDISLIAHDQPPIISHPTKASLALPSMAVVGARADRSALLGTTPVTAHECRNPWLDAPPMQVLAEGSAVIRLVHDRLPGPCARATSLLWRLHRHQCRLGQHAFMRLCASHLQPDGRAIAVCNSHKLRVSAHVGFAIARAPFFGRTKYPSTNACAHSILPWASNRLSNARQIRSHVPWLNQAQKRASRLRVSPIRVAHFPERIQFSTCRECR
jgi:hypothetical protein